MIHWVWILAAAIGGGCLGCLIMAVFAASQITELKLWNRKLQHQRDEAVKDAKNYRELMKIEQ